MTFPPVFRILSRAACVAFAALLGAATASAAEPAAGFDPPDGFPAALTSAMAGIRSERLRADVRFLAHDLLEGRGTGTRGGDLAAQYLAAQLAHAGIAPAGDDGSYFQNVGFIGTRTLDSTTLSFVPTRGEPLPLKLIDDYVVGNQTQRPSVTVDAPLVFVGYGIDAPEFGWNDYAGLDLRGKVALIIVNEPPSTDPGFFAGDALTYYGRWTYKYEEAARRRAVGALIIHRDDLASYPWQVVRSSWGSESALLADDDSPRLDAAGWVQLEVARLLLALGGRELDTVIAEAGRRGFKGFALPITVRASIDSELRRFEAANVLGLLPGSDRDPQSPSQALLYSAHYDHLGIDPNAEGDGIHNGAIDNATGCAVVLAIGRALAGLRDKRPHPVLFAFVTGEEKGLLGSQHLGARPPIPAANIGLALNFDSFAPLGVPESVRLLGSERLNFRPTVERTAQAFGYAIDPDARPLAGSYYRSDHFSFARVGVPAFSVGLGDKFVGHTRDWGREQSRQFTAHHYHQPSDEYREDMDFASSVAIARFGLALGWQALVSPVPIAWLPGDEFERRRKASIDTGR